MISIDYSKLPNRDIMFLDIKSFFASVECVKLRLPIMDSYLAVCSRMDLRGGLVLASTPMMKSRFGIKTGSRMYEIPKRNYITLVPPRMDLYLRVNQMIIDLLLRYVAPEDLLVYSIDEMCVDLTDYVKLYKKDAVTLAKEIQWRIYTELKLISTVALAPNPLLAKIAMDTESKKNMDHFAHWTYDDVPTKLHNIRPLSKMWGIGDKTESKLNDLGIYSVGDLANHDVNILKRIFGIMGEEYFYHAHGVDYTILSDRKTQKQTPNLKRPNISFSSSEVLPKDYTRRFDIETVLREHADKVSKKLRKHKLLATTIKVFVGFSKHEEEDKGFSHQMKIDATYSRKALGEQVLKLFRKYYYNEAVRRIAITCSNLVTSALKPYNLFDDLKAIQKEEKLDKVMDVIQSRFGLKACCLGYSLSEAGTAISRSRLIGGHGTSVGRVN